MRIKHFLLVCFLTMLAVTALAAVEGPASFASDCFSDPVIAEYTVKNELAETLEYSITIEGAANNFDVHITPDKLTLKPEEEGTFYLFIKPCCWAKPGVYTLTLKATSAKKTYTKQISFRVLESRKVILSVQPKELVLGQCEDAEAIVKVENKSPIREEIELSIEGSAADLLTLSTERVIVDAASTKEVVVKAKAPCKTQEKELSASIKAHIKETEIESEKVLKVKLTDKQIIVLEKKDFEACNDVDEVKTLKVKNEGRAEDKLSLSLSGPKWIKLKQKSLSLEPGEEKEIELEFLRTEDEGGFTFELKAHSELYDKETSSKYKVLLKDCYKVSIEKVSGKEEACLEEKKLTYKFKLKNERDKQITVSLSLQGLKGKLDKTELVLSPKEEKEVTATLNIAKETPGKKTLKLALTSAEFSDSAKFPIKLSDCYALKVDSSEIEKEIELELSPQLCPQSKLLTLAAENIGTKEQEVHIKFEGIDWVYLQPKEMKLKPKESKPFYLYVSPAITEQAGTYEGTLTVEAKDYKREFPVKVRISAVTLPEKLSIAAEAEVEETIIEQERTVKAKITLVNTSDCKLEVLDINAQGIEASFEPEQFTMDENASVEITATIYLGKGYDKNKVELPLVLLTDRGIVKKRIVIDLQKETVTEITPEESPVETPAAPAPQAVVAPQIANILLLLFLAIVAVAIVILAYYAYTKEKAAEAKKGKGEKK